MRARPAVLMAVLGVAAATPAFAAKLRVPQQYPTVSAAVAAAAPGDTVEIQGGPYAEQVVVDKSIRLVARGTAVLKAPPAMTGSKAIVTVTGAGVNATILGLTIAGPGDGGCDSLRAGIRVEAGAHATIRRNDILAIRDQPLSGCQNGVGILVGREADDTAGTADIEDNTIAGFQKNGIVVSHEGSSAIVDDNLVVGAGATALIAQNGIQVSDGAVAKVRRNTVRNMRYTPQDVADGGILLFAAGAGSQIDRNTLDHVDVGVFIVSTAGVPVRHNQISRSTYDAIALVETTGSLLHGNELATSSRGGPEFGAGIGLYVSSTGNTIAANTARQNLDNGFFADETSTGNRFRDNLAIRNKAYGFHDHSTGSGTAGTGNVYRRNVAFGNVQGDSSPAGIAQ